MVPIRAGASIEPDKFVADCAPSIPRWYGPPNRPRYGMFCTHSWRASTHLHLRLLMVQRTSGAAGIMWAVWREVNHAIFRLSATGLFAA
jgi:hypothetical protein